MFAAVVGQSWATAAHPFNIEINGIDQIGSVHMDSIRVEMPGPGSNGSMDFEIWDPTAAITITEWDEVRLIEHAATRPILFGGFVLAVAYESWAVNGRTIRVRCVGYGVLLDKKVVPSFSFGADVWSFGERLVSLVNRHGGRISALAAPLGQPADATYSIPEYANVWAIGVADPNFALSGNQTLRGGIDEDLGRGTLTVWDATIYEEPCSSVYWVDTAAMLRAAPNVPAGFVNNGRADAIADQYDSGTVPGLSIDTSGGLTVLRVAYEREDSDRATAAYVVGGNAPGTGYVRLAPLDRAGDLELLINDSQSTDAATLAGRGGSEVKATSAATATGEVEIEARTPVDCWPGRNIRITWAAVGLSAADFRIASCRIAFPQGNSNRVYTVGFGGNAPGGPSGRSAMRKIRNKQRPDRR